MSDANDESGRPASREYGDVDVSGQEWGSDAIADLLKAYGFEFVSFNPGASFRGLEESIVNYNDNDPQVILTPHEGLSVSIAHGYAKTTGEPALCILHNVVGTMHAAMGLYNAYIDRVPLLALSGTGPLRKTERRPWIDWIHSALVQGNIVRDFVKWDDQPDHIDGMAESLTRAHRIADTPPKGPTYVTLDHSLQENELDAPVELPELEKLDPPSGLAPDPASIADAADRLVAADHPVILVDKLGDSRQAVEALVDLAERLGAGVFDPRRRRFNFPNTHPMDLTGTDAYREADVVLGLDAWDLNYMLLDTDRVRHENTDAMAGEFELIDVGLREQEASSLFPNYYGQRETDVAIAADTHLAVPALADAVAERLDADDAARERAADRAEAFAEIHERQRSAWREETERAWDETPIAVSRLAAEVSDLMADHEWVVVGNGNLSGWVNKVWEIDEFDQYIGGGSGGGGVGYGIGAAIGAALAHRDSDRIPVNFQRDGDLMYYAGGLWVQGRYGIPMLNVMHNNQSLYNSTEHRLTLAAYRGRDDSIDRAHIGTGYVDPTPNYAEMAESMGVNGYGPVEDPDDLPGVLEAALEDVLAGEPALVDAVTQPD